MAPHVIHWCTHGQGRWRGHHWQWPRPRLYQSQHLHPCSGCLRCSDGCRRRCRKRSSEDVCDAAHSQGRHSYMVLSNPNTPCHPLSVGIALELMVVAGLQTSCITNAKQRFSTFLVGFYAYAYATSLWSFELRFVVTARGPPPPVLSK